MKKIAVVFHSGFGHTAYFAEKVASGARTVRGVEVQTLSVDAVQKDLEALKTYDGILFGSPTYMGAVSGPFKTFMDATSALWMKGELKNKFAGGFTVSGSPSGDKLQTLISMAIFAAQHGMIWVGNHLMPETYLGVAPDQAANRLGSFLGAMATAGQVPPEQAFVPGDLKTADLFGKRFAEIVVGSSR